MMYFYEEAGNFTGKPKFTYKEIPLEEMKKEAEIKNSQTESEEAEISTSGKIAQ